LIGLLILLGRIGERGGLLSAKANTPNLQAKEAGTPVWGSLYPPLQKLLARFSPGGLEKIPISWGFFSVLTYY